MLKEIYNSRHIFLQYIFIIYIPVGFFILGEGSCVIATKVPSNFATEHLTS